MAEFTLNGLLAERAAQMAPKLAAALGEPADDALLYVCSLSDFAAAAVTQHAEWLAQARRRDRFAVAPARADVMAACEQALEGVEDMQSLQRSLRTLRNRFQLWIVWRHLVARAPLAETTRALSDLADVLIDQALERVYLWACRRDGTPVEGTAGRNVWWCWRWASWVRAS